MVNYRYIKHLPDGILSGIPDGRLRLHGYTLVPKTTDSLRVLLGNNIVVKGKVDKLNKILYVKDITIKEEQSWNGK